MSKGRSRKFPRPPAGPLPPRGGPVSPDAEPPATPSPTPPGDGGPGADGGNGGGDGGPDGGPDACCLLDVSLAAGRGLRRGVFLQLRPVGDRVGAYRASEGGPLVGYLPRECAAAAKRAGATRVRVTRAAHPGDAARPSEVCVDLVRDG